MGLCSASAAATRSPVTDCPWGTSTMVTFAGRGSSGLAARSSLVAAFMRMVRPSRPLKVPLTKATTLSPGRMALSAQSRPLKPVPPTP